MREFFDRLNWRIAEFMQGRYGMDTLNKVLLIIALILLLAGPIISPFDFLGWIFVLAALFRALSKNISKRQAELLKFNKIIKGPKKFVKKTSTKFKNRNTTVYFKCKGCGQELSVPKGKGKIRVICPKCKTEIFKTT